MWCCYNTVNFPPKSSQQTLHSSSMRTSYGVSFVGFKFWFIFCFSQSSVVWNTGLILGLRPANVRWRYISHWLGASLESALKYHVISDSIIMAFACTKLSSHFGQVTPCGIRVLGRHRSLQLQVMAYPLFCSESDPGPRLNIKTVLSTYGDFHVKDKTAIRTSYL